MFAPKEGSESSGRGRVERRRRESGGQFGERAYARAAEREAEAAAEKAGKGKGGGGLTDEQRAQREKERQEDRAERKADRAERKAKEAAREAERKAKEAAREAERKAKAAESAQRKIDLANHQYKDKRIPPGFARKMLDAQKGTPQAGISDVKDALSVQDKAGKLPFEGPEKIAFMDYLRERMPESRLQLEEDGSGWYLDVTGRLYQIEADDDYVKKAG